MNLGHSDDLSGAERIEAVDEGDADLDFGGLAVWVSRGDAFSEGLEAAHLGLGPAWDVISGPALPERPSIVPGGAQRFVAGDCGRAVFVPRPAVLTDRDDCSGLAVDDGSVAAAHVIGHDIQYRFEYPDVWIFDKRWSWNEIYIVRAAAAAKAAIAGFATAFNSVNLGLVHRLKAPTERRFENVARSAHADAAFPCTTGGDDDEPK